MTRRSPALLRHEDELVARFAAAAARAAREAVRAELDARGILGPAGIPSRGGEEDTAWRDSQGSTAPTPIETASDSSWSEREANEIIHRMRRKKKRAT